MDPEEKRKEIEMRLLQIVKEKLEKGEMDAQRASQIAVLVTRTLRPGMSIEELYRAVPALDDQFPELAPAVLSLLQEQEQQVGTVVREHMQRLIHDGQYEEAAALGKGATAKPEQDQNLSSTDQKPPLPNQNHPVSHQAEPAVPTPRSAGQMPQSAGPTP